MNEEVQCDSRYEVWRCILNENHRSVHESYTVIGADLFWTHDKTIAICIMPRM